MIDLTNKVFDRLTVVKKVKKFNKNTSVMWECKCICGNTTIVNSLDLRSNHTKSCGCLKKENKKSGHKKWKGCGDISGKFFCILKQNALKRKIDFNISIEYIWELFLKQQKKCKLSNIDITFSSNSSKFDGTASLDRIDSSKGYIEGNVQWVHKDVNMMKQNYSQKYFIEMCKKIYETNKNIDLTKVVEYDDNTELKENVACAGNNCEIK